jgi:hypothetical protein
MHYVALSLEYWHGHIFDSIVLDDSNTNLFQSILSNRTTKTPSLLELIKEGVGNEVEHALLTWLPNHMH